MIRSIGVEARNISSSVDSLCVCAFVLVRIVAPVRTRAATRFMYFL